MRDSKDYHVYVNQIMAALDDLAPPELAADWDTAIGLEIGDPKDSVSRVLLTLDVTSQAVAIARESGFNLIITHHPLLFSPLPSIRQDVPEQRLAAELIKARINLIAAHTNLDAAQGGVADCLANRLGLQSDDRQIVGMYGRHGKLPEPRLISDLISFVKKELGSPGCRINTDDNREISHLAVFPGSFSEDELPLLITSGIDAIICGEIKHHVALMLAARGIVAIDAGHDVTERVVLRPLAAKLALKLPQIAFAVYEGLDYNKVAFRASQTTAGDGRKAAYEESPGSIG